MATFARTLIAASLLAVSTGSFAAGQIEVRHVDPLSYSDAGFGAAERERTQQLLTRHLEGLAAQMPTGQTLRIEVLDVDLAGELQWINLEHLRVLGRGADGPRLHLRFELRQGDAVVLAGEERLTDPGYRLRAGQYGDTEALHVERRMIDAWFHDRFSSRVAGLR